MSDNDKLPVKAALLLIDIQRDYSEPAGRLPVRPSHVETMMPNLNGLLALREQLGLVPVYITNQFKKGDLLNIFRNWATLEGTEGSALDPRLSSGLGPSFFKRTTDAFSNPDLLQFLRKQGIDTLYFSGIQAEACVWATFNSAKKLGFKCIVITDALGSLSDSNLSRMLRKYESRADGCIKAAALMKMVSP